MKKFFLASLLMLYGIGLAAIDFQKPLSGVESEVTNQRRNLYLIISDQCPYCDALTHALSSDSLLTIGLNAEYKLKIIEIHSQEGQIIASTFDIRSVPTFIVFSQNTTSWTIIKGYSDAAHLASALKIPYPSHEVKTAELKSLITNRSLMICGNGVIEGGESCDDGGENNGDGCSSTCMIEPGWSCFGTPSVCIQTSACGNGIIEGGESCDDGGVNSGDGCSSTCMIESGWMCFGTPSVCTQSACGNGIIEGGESCDDGGVNSGDGCSSTCMIESGWMCVGTPSVCTQTSVCGNGIIESGESCDDGGVYNGDGCSYTCMIEPDWICVGMPSVCVLNVVCGNGIIEQGEDCDDGNPDNGDGCDYLCHFEGTPKGVAINMDGTRPDPSAMLHVKSTNSGILIPRMTSPQRVAIPNPSNGLLVFDMTTGSFWYFFNSTWKQISTN
ncbi:MAG TPA: DUF4215 domain-containing protein [Saprospiraceae bacterium]|nr:DUF4215 domain-containing protein [Saprospiraceae bacterium]